MGNTNVLIRLPTALNQYQRRIKIIWKNPLKFFKNRLAGVTDESNCDADAIAQKDEHQDNNGHGDTKDDKKCKPSFS